MKLLLLPFAIILGAAAAPPPADLQTGRSVAVDAPSKYWLSNDLNRLFLQKPASRAVEGSSEPR